MATTHTELTALAESCSYDPERECSGSVCALIDYKDALEDRARLEGDVLDAINAMLSRPSWDGAAGMLEDIHHQLRRVREPMSKAERHATLGGPYLQH